MMDNTAPVQMMGSSDSSSIGEAVSGRGRNRPDDDDDDDDDLYYIPERRPSLVLSSDPMDWTSQWWCLVFS